MKLDAKGMLPIRIGLLLSSMSILMLEILQTVVLSLQLFHNVAFIVIAASMLGLGAGGSFAVLVGRRVPAHPDRFLGLLSMVCGVAIVGSVAATSRLSSMAPIVAIGTVPYLLGGLFFALAFRWRPEGSGTTYFFSLAGSAVGCVAVLGVLSLSADAGAAVLASAALSLLGAFVLLARGSRPWAAASLCLVLSSCILLPYTEGLFPFRPAPAKHYGYLLSNERIETTLERSRWGFFGRLDAVVPGRGIEEFRYGSVAREALDQGCDFRFLFASGDNWSYMIHFRGNDAFRYRFVRTSPLSAPYALLREPRVLNIGLGGAADVFIALGNGARSVVGVEINPLMIEAIRGWYPGYFDGVALDPRVEVVEMDGRTYVDQAPRSSFDLVTLTAVDTGAGIASGANLLSESFLYTREAMDGYIRILRDDGLLFFLRPLPELLRIALTAKEALAAAGAEHPERHLLLYGGTDEHDWLGLIVRRSPLAEAEIDGLARSLARGELGGGQIFYPRWDLSSVTGDLGRAKAVHHALTSPVPLRERSLDLGVNLEPVTDDSPYFFEQSIDYFGSESFRLLGALLLWIVVASVVLLLSPLAFVRGARAKAPVLSRVAYFACIGLGFMLVEICMVQKLVRHLGHPAYSVSVTLFSMLLFSGLGSLASSRIPRNRPRLHLAVFAGIVALVLLADVTLALFSGGLASGSPYLRALAAMGFLAPMSFLLGMPFPLMLRTAAKEVPEVIPWLCAANGCASVVASVLAVLLGMTIGFSGALAVAAAAYLLAALSMLRASGQVRSEA